MKGQPSLKKFKDWFLKQRAEAEKIFFPKVIDESMLKGRSYKLRNKDQLQIRMGDVGDVEAIIEIQLACYEGKAPWGKLVVYNELQNRNSLFLLASDHEEVIAFIAISFKADQMHITNIATKPNYQKQGIASFLIRSTAVMGQEIDKKVITLEVRTSNEKAKSLYRKIGFKDLHIMKNYYQDNGEDALQMSYKIQEDG